MKPKSYVTMLAAVGVLALFMLMLAGSSKAVYKTEITSPYTETVPTIDGVFTTDTEWTDADVVSWWFEPESAHHDNFIFIYAKNTADKLYFMVDVTPDNTSDWSDYVALAFDENSNDIFTSEWTFSDPAEFYISAYRNGFTYMAQPSDRASVVFGFDISPNEDGYDHTMVEFSVDISSFNYQGQVALGDTMGFHVEGYGTLAPEWAYPRGSTNLSDVWALPGGVDHTVEDWGTITLGEYVAPEPEPEPTTDQPVDKSEMIGIGIVIIGFIVFASGVAFREELGNVWFAVVAVASLLLIIFGVMEFNYHYFHTIPYIAQ